MRADTGEDYSIHFAQSAGPGSVYHIAHWLPFRANCNSLGSLLEPLRCSFQVQNRLGRPRCPMNPQHRNKLTLLDPFWDPKSHKKVTRTSFYGGPEMVPKTDPHSGSQKVRFCSFLLHLSKVRRLRNGLGSCLKTRFAKNTKT